MSFAFLPRLRWSLRTQLLMPQITLCAAILAISVLAAVSSVNFARDRINEQIADIVATLDESSFPLSENVLRLLKGFTGADFLIVEKTGVRLTTLKNSAPSIHTLLGDDSRQQTVRLERAITINGTSYLCAEAPIRHGRPKEATLFLFYPESLWRDSLWQAMRPSLIVGAIFSLGAILFTMAQANRLTKRVRVLERQTRQIAEGDFSPMQLPKRNDELRDLGQSVNKMAERLTALEETIQNSERMRLLGQVSGGLAHQLRNSVAGARLAVQLHAREHPNVDDDSLAVALRQLALVEMQIRTFLQLGNRDAPQRTPCSLRKILLDAINLILPRCRHAHVDLQPDIQPDFDDTILGDQQQLAQSFVNLLVNAIDAAGPQGQVRVQLNSLDGSHIGVRIHDSGPGPPPHIADKIFEPFVTGKTDGIGLGLALTKEIIAAHGGSIRWEKDGSGMNFHVEIPVEQQG